MIPENCKVVKGIEIDNSGNGGFNIKARAVTPKAADLHVKPETKYFTTWKESS